MLSRARGTPATTKQTRGIIDHRRSLPYSRGMRWLAPALVVVGFLAVGGALSGPGGRLGDVQRNDSAAYLPAQAEATEALNESKRFTGVEATPAILVYTKPTDITESDVRQLTLAALNITNALNM